MLSPICCVSLVRALPSLGLWAVGLSSETSTSPAVCFYLERNQGMDRGPTEAQAHLSPVDPRCPGREDPLLTLVTVRSSVSSKAQAAAIPEWPMSAHAMHTAAHWEGHTGTGGTLASPGDTQGHRVPALCISRTQPTGPTSRVQSCGARPQEWWEPRGHLAQPGVQGGLQKALQEASENSTCKGRRCDEPKFVLLEGKGKAGGWEGGWRELTGPPQAPRWTLACPPASAHLTDSRAQTCWGHGTPGRLSH